MLEADLAHTLGTLRLDVELRVRAGRCLAVVGPSGGGKTTVLRMLAGLITPARGRIVCGGRTWLDTERGIELAPEHRRCGYVFQDEALFGHLRAWQNVAFPLWAMPRSARRARALALLERVGLSERAEAHPTGLSGGERRRVALARALAVEPALLLLDEPLSGLDPAARDRLLIELSAIRDALGVPMILVTHDRTEAERLAHEVAVLDGGRIHRREPTRLGSRA